MKKTLIIFSCLLLIAGCRTGGHIGEGDASKLSVGMSRADVIRKLGNPESVINNNGVEILGYSVERPWAGRSQLRVKLEQGKVESYEVTDQPK